MRAYDITKAQQDLRYLSWNELDNPSGLHVQEATAREGTGTRAVLYRAPITSVGARYVPPSGANELVACRLMDALGIPHADTRLVNGLVRIADNEQALWITRYKNLRGTGVRSMPLESFFELRAEQGESPLDFCVRMGWKQQLAQMMLIDYLTANRTRSARELHVQALPDGGYKLAPLMGGRVALSCSFPSATWRVNAMADLSTSNYIGSVSLEENLRWAVEVFREAGSFPDSVHEERLKRFKRNTADKGAGKGMDAERGGKATDEGEDESENKDAVPGASAAPSPPCASLSGFTRKELFRSLDAVYNPLLAQLEGSWQVIRRRWEQYARLCRV